MIPSILWVASSFIVLFLSLWLLGGFRWLPELYAHITRTYPETIITVRADRGDSTGKIVWDKTSRHQIFYVPFRAKQLFPHDPVIRAIYAKMVLFFLLCCAFLITAPIMSVLLKLS